MQLFSLIAKNLLCTPGLTSKNSINRKKNYINSTEWSKNKRINKRNERRFLYGDILNTEVLATQYLPGIGCWRRAGGCQAVKKTS
jgi:hypothetical protein